MRAWFAVCPLLRSVALTGDAARAHNRIGRSSQTTPVVALRIASPHRQMTCLPTGLYPGPEQVDEERAFERLLPSVTCTVVRGGWYEFPPGWRVAPRVPTYSIAFFCVSGTAHVRIGDQVYALAPGTVILSPVDVPQELWNEASQPVWMHTVAFSARLYGLLDLPTLCGLPVEQHLDDDRFNEVVGIARQLVRELLERRPGYGLATNAACLRLVACSGGPGPTRTASHRESPAPGLSTWRGSSRSSRRSSRGTPRR